MRIERLIGAELTYIEYEDGSMRSFIFRSTHALAVYDNRLRRSDYIHFKPDGSVGGMCPNTQHQVNAFVG